MSGNVSARGPPILFPPLRVFPLTCGQLCDSCLCYQKHKGG